LRIERKNPLDTLEPIHHEEAGGVEDQHGDRVSLPSHLLAGPHARHPVDEALEPAEDTVEAERSALVDASHVIAEGLGEGQEHHQIEEELDRPVGRHANISGLSKARTR
jgi:hypothetical protein